MRPRPCLSVLLVLGALWSLVVPVVSAIEPNFAASARPHREPTSPVDVRLLAPAEGAYTSGPTMLRAHAEPSAAVASVVFSVDGTEVCRRTQLPFECEWDAGSAVAPHHVRVVANLLGGGRLVHSIRTASLAFAETVDVHAVQVTVTVTDRNGHYVDGLPRSAFRVFEDGRPQTVSHFFAADAPLELVVALDLSSSMAPALAEMKRTAAAFLRALPARHRLTLLGFNDEVFTLLPRTADARARDDVIGSLSAWGRTALYEAIERSTEMLRTHSGRKAAVVFTDGQDQGSHIAMDDVERTLQASDVLLYMIGHGLAAERVTLKHAMDRLAGPTGGRALAATSMRELERSFLDLFEEMSHQYVIGYQAPPGSRDNQWHGIEVKVDGGHHVRARKGYRTSL